MKKIFICIQVIFCFFVYGESENQQKLYEFIEKPFLKITINSYLSEISDIDEFIMQMGEPESLNVINDVDDFPETQNDKMYILKYHDFIYYIYFESQTTNYFIDTLEICNFENKLNHYLYPGMTLDEIVATYGQPNETLYEKDKLYVLYLYEAEMVGINFVLSERGLDLIYFYSGL